MTSPIDIDFMRMALNLARRGLGHAAPNPSVGCVIVKGGAVVGRGRTATGGRPHAEVIALEHAGVQAEGATVYVSLEPCSHEGKTGPCAQALIDAGVARVVVACTDPDPRVSGRGVEMLQGAGIEVTQDVLRDEALALNRGFILRVSENRPFVTLKCAISADGKIAAAAGERTQISGVLAKCYMHLLRSGHDAIMVGKTTFEVDQPKLTTRIEGYAHESLVVVLDKDVAHALADLAEQGITRLLVEGGAKVHQSFLDSGLFDEVQLLKSPKILGEQGVSMADFEGAPNLKLQKTRVLGEDMLEIYRRAH